MKTKLLCTLLTLLICASCENPWMREILEPKTITFDSNGGSHVSSQNLIKGKKVTRPANPSRSGFAFDAWYIDNGTFEKPWNFNIVPTYGFTLYAKWNLSGEYAAGTAGLVYELINGNTAYRVSRGTATGNIVIPAYHRPNADSPYLPVTEIGNGVDTVSNNAFGGTSSSVTSITFAEGSQLTTISGYAFYDCTGLTGITIPANVTSIGQNAFIGCTNLKNIIIDTDKVTSYNGNLFFMYNNWGTIFPANGLSVTFRKNVGEYAFMGSYDLTSVTIAAGVTTIGLQAFENCGSLTSVTIAEGVKIIGDIAFSSCEPFSIIIPATVESIGYQSFYCNSLTSVTFLAGTIASGSFDNNAFFGNLRTVYFASGGGAGTYTKPDMNSQTWTKQ